MTKNFDIIFYCDANQNTGFGHASRCAQISYTLNKINPNIKMGIKGNLTEKSKKTIRNINKHVKFIDSKEDKSSKIAFIDKMFDYEEPNYIEHSFLNKIKNKSDKIIIMFSGVCLKLIDDNITYIGYHPIKKKYNKNNILWDIQYAPTNILEEKKVIRKKNTIFIALGGHKNNDELKKLVLSINLIKEIKTIDILLSPVGKKLNLEDNLIRSNLKINYFTNIKSLYHHLAGATLVITSFGNLFYESLAHKSPTLIVAQKKFQFDYAKQFEKYSNIINLGFPSTLSINKIKIRIKKLLFNKSIDKEKLINIPRDGIVNIANIINF